LARVEAGRPVVVFLHIPVHSTASLRRGEAVPSPRNAVTNREALYRLLEPYAAHVISGHTHESEHVFEGGIHEHVCGAACGAWWSGPICYDGTPNGYAVYEVRGEDVRWRYQATGHDPAYQMRVYDLRMHAPGTDGAARGPVVANVWDWDPAWSVVWYEDGEPRGPMERRTGTDPLSERLHRGSDLPERRSWVDPVPTDHLFHATPAPAARTLRIEATDRFGRVYTVTV
ncbi:MAG: calcineurin-like phosphoesterase C-terminal domain-containing protein, partial [Rhodothermales bacterium]|nr:calcineurin-like phosphoesterase C-terminal domain-containing protein [Rhodothermales bacterium]